MWPDNPSVIVIHRPRNVGQDRHGFAPLIPEVNYRDHSAFPGRVFHHVEAIGDRGREWARVGQCRSGEPTGHTPSSASFRKYA